MDADREYVLAGLRAARERRSAPRFADELLERIQGGDDEIGWLDSSTTDPAIRADVGDLIALYEDVCSRLTSRLLDEARGMPDDEGEAFLRAEGLL